MLGKLWKRGSRAIKCANSSVMPTLVKISMKHTKSKPSCPMIKLPAISPHCKGMQRTKSFCVPKHLSAESPSQPNKRYSFTIAATKALASLPKPTAPKALPPVPHHNFLPRTHFYWEKRPTTLHRRFTHMNHTLQHIPCLDFISALLTGEPFIDDVLSSNVQRCSERLKVIHAVQEEDDQSSVC